MLDTPVTNAELDSFYGMPKTELSYYSDLIRETVTKTVRKVPHQVLSLPCVTYRDCPIGKVSTTPINEVVADQCSAGKPLDALMAVIAGSDCLLVAKLREAISAQYIYSNADDLAEVAQ